MVVYGRLWSSSGVQARSSSWSGLVGEIGRSGLSTNRVDFIGIGNFALHQTMLRNALVHCLLVTCVEYYLLTLIIPSINIRLFKE